jgi:serine/threonine protein kinase
MPEIFTGLVLDERYEIQAPLGSGGLSLVFEAQDRRLDRQVAVKVIKPELTGSADIIDAFIRQTRLIASLSHPHILPIFDYGTKDTGIQELPFLVMQLASGGGLLERFQEQPLELDEAERILRQVCSALDYAHDRHVIHLDLKPANILFDEQGNALVADFGLTRLFSTSSQETPQGIVGTRSYMPYEQWQGRPAGRLSDVYALGMTLHEVLTGRLPERDLIEGDLVVHPERSLPDPIYAVIEKATQPHPNERQPSAGKLARDFSAAVAASTPPPEPFGIEGSEGGSALQDAEKLGGIRQSPSPWPVTELDEGISIQRRLEEMETEAVLPPIGSSSLRKLWLRRIGVGLAVLGAFTSLFFFGQRWLKGQMAKMLSTAIPPSTTPTFTATATATPTATPSPLPTLTPSPTTAPTPTPSPIPHFAVPIEHLYVYTGPDEATVVIGEVFRGDRLPLLGRLADGTWWEVEYLGSKGWIFAQSVGASIDPTLLPVVNAPSMPTRTATPTQETSPSPEPVIVPRLRNPGFAGAQGYNIPNWSVWAVDNYERDGEYDSGASYDTPFFSETHDPARQIDGPTLQIEATAFVKFKVYVYQTVEAPSGVAVLFQTLAQAYSTLDDGRIKMAVGIDPTGSTGCSQVQWGEELLVDQSLGTVQLVTPQVVVNDGERVTVCLYAETLYPARSNAAYFDNATLIIRPE